MPRWLSADAPTQRQCVNFIALLLIETVESAPWDELIVLEDPYSILDRKKNASLSNISRTSNTIKQRARATTEAYATPSGHLFSYPTVVAASE
jgi:hypothetical protein